MVFFFVFLNEIGENIQIVALARIQTWSIDQIVDNANGLIQFLVGPNWAKGKAQDQLEVRIPRFSFPVNDLACHVDLVGY